MRYQVPQFIEVEDKIFGVPKLDLPKLSDSKLKELSWGLDINENVK
jgi:hypothetical protein